MGQGEYNSTGGSNHWGESDGFDLPEDRSASFDEAALLEAMRDYRRREFAELAQLDSGHSHPREQSSVDGEPARALAVHVARPV